VELARLAEGDDRVTVAGVALVLGVGGQRAKVALLDLALQAQLAEDWVLQGYGAEGDTHLALHVAAGLDDRAVALLDHDGAPHARSRELVDTLHGDVEQAVRPIDERHFLVALDGAQVGQDV
jgi:hypothetical protein